ncbi:hypothetical protein [Lysinibacillus sp. OTC-L20]
MKKKLKLSDMIKFQPTSKQVKNNMMEKVKAVKQQEETKNNKR